MYVPIQFCAGIEGGIDAREELAGEVRGEVAADEVVAEGREEEFVNVKREGGEGEGVGERCRPTGEQCGRRIGERVVHGSGTCELKAVRLPSRFRKVRYRGMVVSVYKNGDEAVQGKRLGREQQGNSVSI